VNTATTPIRDGSQASSAEIPTGSNPDRDGRAPSVAFRAGSGVTEAVVTGVALVVCIAARLPHRALEAAGVTGWVLAVVVVVAVVNGVRMVVRAPFTRSISPKDVTDFVVMTVIGAVLTVPLYAFLRATPRWWLYAWLLFAAVTLLGQMAMPLILRAQSGPLHPADPRLAELVAGVAQRAGLEVRGGVLVAGKHDDRRCNAYVVGLGPTRRVVIESGTAAWAPELVDQVVAHEIGHWRLGHAATRLPLALACQLATLAAAAWVLSLQPLLHWGGVSSVADPRSYPLLLLLTPVLALPARCLLAWRDRAQEREADRFALALLGTPDQFSAMLERAANEGGAARTLSGWRRLTASHPPISERAAACTRFASTG
jgi:STE24 endopeptidase